MSSETDDGRSHVCSVTEVVERTIRAHRNRTGKDRGEQQKQSYYLIGEGI